jgi:hypothetical protein
VGHSALATMLLQQATRSRTRGTATAATIILGPGGYRFSDFWRVGQRLEII